MLLTLLRLNVVCLPLTLTLISDEVVERVSVSLPVDPLTRSLPFVRSYRNTFDTPV